MMPKSTTEIAEPPKRTATPTPSKPHGSQLPILIQIPPPEPVQEQIAKTNEQNKKQENNTLKGQ